MLKDINRTTGRNLDLIEARIKELKAVVAEADRHLAFAKDELAKQMMTVSVHKKIDSLNPSQQHKGTFSGSVAEQYSKNAKLQSSLGVGMKAGEAYSVTPAGRQYVSQGSKGSQSMSGQGDLFEQAYNNENTVVSNTGTSFTVDSDGASVATVPVLGLNVTYADNPVQPEKSFEDMVKDLYFVGHSVEEIARELNSSTTEVQFVIEMNSLS